LNFEPSFSEASPKQFSRKGARFAKKGSLFWFQNQGLMIPVASFVYGRAYARAGYGFARGAFRFDLASSV
jgi:hypothetical protein